MRKILLLLAVLYVGTAFSQSEDSVVVTKKPKKQLRFKDRIFPGGNVSALFGNYTFVNVSPQAGYYFGRFLEAGVGINLQYVSQKYFDQNGDKYYKESYYVYGGNLFARLYPVRPVFIQLQPEYNWIQARLKYYNLNYPVQKYSAHAPSLLMGVGGSFEGVLVSVMYDVLQRPSSPYSSKPFISIGFGYGFDN